VISRSTCVGYPFVLYFSWCAYLVIERLIDGYLFMCAVYIRVFIKSLDAMAKKGLSGGSDVRNLLLVQAVSTSD
jgi:hypothetical protein